MNPVEARPDVLSVTAIRQRFPALARTEGGHPVAYFDGPGGTQVPQEVADAVTDYLLRHNANTHWAYPTSIETDAMLMAARGALADFLGGDPSEVAFGANMTTLTFHLARSLGRDWDRGDEIVVTELDHHANVDPWRALEKERGVVIRVLPVDAASGQLDLEALPKLLSRKTRLLAIGAASNALGTISDVRRAATLAHEAGALVFVDAVHYAPHALLDVAALGCDFLACSPYKFYGPHLGVLWGKRERLAALDVPRLEPAPDRPPERLETGTLSHEGIVGAAAAVDFLASLAAGSTRRERLALSFEVLEARGRELLSRLWRGLKEIPHVTLYGPTPERPRTPTVSFTLARRMPEAVAQELARHGVFVSHGDFYAPTLVARLGHGRDGLVRAGCVAYTTAEEVDRLVAGVREIARC